MASNLLAEAQRLTTRGLRVIPLPYKSKKPALNDWPNLRLDNSDLPRFFNGKPSNIGLLCGVPSGGVVTVDLDCPETLDAAPYLLPPTGMVSGRRSAPTSHWSYKTEAPPAKARDAYSDPTAGGPGKAGGLLLEILSTGAHRVIPPSVYAADPAKGTAEEPCIWHAGGDPADVPVAALRAAVGSVAAAALLARHWPTGRRHDLALAVAGGLLRAEWAVEKVETFLTAVCVAAGDDDTKDRLRAVRDTADKLAAGNKEVSGWPKAAEYLGRDGGVIVEQVRAWLGVLTEPARPKAPPDDGPAAEFDREWPAPPRDDAMYGLAGDIVRAIAPASEADPAAILSQTLVMFGNAIGRSAHFAVESTRHYANEFMVLIGQTAKGRKGTSADQCRRLFRAADESWVEDRNQSGLSSGEGLIWAVRDPIEKLEKVKGQPLRSEMVLADPGEADKRLLVYEPEFASVLKQTERQGNTLSVLIRQAWESGSLRTMTKHSPARATDAHVSIIGHVTAEELSRSLSATETANGFGNRFLWVGARRSQLLPEGGTPDPGAMAAVTRRLAEAIAFARGVGEVRRDADAREVWRGIYAKLSAGQPGLAGCLLGRAEAHVMRLAMNYALMDGSVLIRVEHLAAALALWEYCERTVVYVFGDSLGDPLADDLLKFVRRAGDRGVSRSDIATHLVRNVPAEKINRALGLLRSHGRAVSREVKTTGRPAEWWFPTRG